jgi:hypothetical protein
MECLLMVETQEDRRGLNNCAHWECCVHSVR